MRQRDADATCFCRAANNKDATEMGASVSLRFSAPAQDTLRWTSMLVLMTMPMFLAAANNADDAC